MRIKFWRKKPPEKEITLLETLLDAIYQPVEPKPFFVSDLKARLMGAPIPVRTAPTRRQLAMLAVAGVVSGVIILVTGLRAAVTVLVALGILRQMKGQMGGSQAATLPPAI